MSKFVAVLGILAGAAGAEVPACIIADPSCKESLAVGDFSFWYFRSYALQTANPSIERAVIVTHGLQRNASDYFVATVNALHNETDPTLLVIAPHFKGFVRNSPTCNDPLEAGELHWSCTGQGSINRWDDGGLARDTGSAVVYSFSMIDHLLGADHALAIVPSCGHDEFCMYAAPEMIQAILF